MKKIFMKNENWSKINKGNSWTDEELMVILSDAPTKVNCTKYAQAFKRGTGSIEQIYRWAMTSRKEINEKRPGEKFVLQIKRISKKIGWV